MKLFALRTSDSKEWVGLTPVNQFYVSNIPALFDKDKWNDEAWEYLCIDGKIETGHPCKWVEVQIIEAKPVTDEIILQQQLHHSVIAEAWFVEGFRAAMKYFQIEQS